jgi:hypothetical protein
MTVVSKKMLPSLNLITVFSKKIFAPWPSIQERLELFPGLELGQNETDIKYLLKT